MPTTPALALVCDVPEDEGHRVCTQATVDRDPGDINRVAPDAIIRDGAAVERMRTMDALRTPLCEAVLRVQLLRRRLRRGDDPALVAAELETVEAGPVRLAAAAERADEAGPG